MKIASILFISLFFKTTSIAQSRLADHWYFGIEAGLDFSSGQAVADTLGKLVSIEGSCSISDTSGNLLFYSNGEMVWDRNHQLMPNGDNILGNQSSVQSSLIVPMPGSNTKFYLFTTGGPSFPEGYGLKYSIIDMAMHGGLGDVTAQKNVELISVGTEELAGTLHCNGNDYWVITRANTDANLIFYVYHIHDAGIDGPFMETFQSNLPVSAVGNITISQDGNLISYTNLTQSLPVYLFDFDTQSGHIYLSEKIAPNPEEAVYSTAFSPDKSKLYAVSWESLGNCYVSQFDLNATDVALSRINLDSVDFSIGSPNGYGFIGRMQLAPDQKIYISRWKQDMQGYSLDSLDAIQFPNISGSGCGFQRNLIHLKGKPTEIGLPNFVSNFTGPLPINAPCGPLHNSNLSRDIYFKVYPNPFSEKTTLETNYPTLKDLSIDLYDLTGRDINASFTYDYDTIEIKTEGLPKGIYFMTIWDDGELLKVIKLIVQ